MEIPVNPFLEHELDRSRRFFRSWYFVSAWLIFAAALFTYFIWGKVVFRPVIERESLVSSGTSGKPVFAEVLSIWQADQKSNVHWKYGDRSIVTRTSPVTGLQLDTVLLEIQQLTASESNSDELPPFRPENLIVFGPDPRLDSDRIVLGALFWCRERMWLEFINEVCDSDEASQIRKVLNTEMTKWTKKVGEPVAQYESDVWPQNGQFELKQILPPWTDIDHHYKLRVLEDRAYPANEQRKWGVSIDFISKRIDYSAWRLVNARHLASANPAPLMKDAPVNWTWRTPSRGIVGRILTWYFLSFSILINLLCFGWLVPAVIAARQRRRIRRAVSEELWLSFDSNDLFEACARTPVFELRVFASLLLIPQFLALVLCWLFAGWPMSFGSLLISPHALQEPDTATAVAEAILLLLFPLGIGGLCVRVAALYCRQLIGAITTVLLTFPLVLFMFLFAFFCFLQTGIVWGGAVYSIAVFLALTIVLMALGSRVLQRVVLIPGIRKSILALHHRLGSVEH